MSNDDAQQEDLFFQSTVDRYLDNPRFLRRDWLTAEVEEHLEDPECRFVLLTAEPGFGKSVFMAQLAHDHPDWPRYFIRRDQREVLADVSSHSFLLRIGYQLAANFPELFERETLQIAVEQHIGVVQDMGEAIGAEVKKIVASPFYEKGILKIFQHIDKVSGRVVGLQIDELVVEPRHIELEDLLHLALIYPARIYQELCPEEQIVILVDALDEVQYHETTGNLLRWLTNWPELPDNVRFVLTTRPPEGAVQLFIEQQVRRIEHLILDDEQSSAFHRHVDKDVQNYVAGFLAEPRVRVPLEKQADGVNHFRDEAIDKADGNLGYLDALARGIDQALEKNDEQTLQALISLQNLPDDIEGLYAFFLHRIKASVAKERIEVEDPETGESYDKAIWPAVHRRILGVLAAAREPVSLETIQRLGGVTCDWIYLTTAIESFTPFLDVIKDSYRLYHATLPEFLTDSKTKNKHDTKDLYVDPVLWHKRIVNYYWSKYHPDWILCTHQYGLRNLARHVYESGDNKRLQQLISREWMYARSSNDSLLSGFAEDVGLAWRSETAQTPPDPISLAHLHTAQQSVYEHASSYSDVYLGALVVLGREREAISLARFRDDRFAKFEGLMAIFRQLTDAEQQAIDTEENRERRTSTLAILVEELDRAAHHIDSDAKRATVLSELGAALVKANMPRGYELFDEAKAILSTLEWDRDQVHGYRKLATCLADAGDLRAGEIYLQAAKIANDTSGSSQRTYLQLLAKDLRLPGMEPYVFKLVEFIMQNTSASDHGYLLGWVTNSLMEIQRFEDAEKVARLIEKDSERAKALQQVADGLAGHDRTRAISILYDAADAAMTDENSIGRAYGLGQIASRLANLGDSRADELFEAAEEAANDPRMPEWNRQFALSHLARNLVRGGRFDQAKRIARSIGDPNLRKDMNEGLVGSLASAGHFDEAEQAARSIPHTDARDLALYRVVSALVGAKQFDRAEEICKSIGQVLGRRDQALGELVRTLAQDGQVDRAIRIAQSMSPGEEKTDVLASLASTLAPHDRPRAGQILDLASESAADIEGGETAWWHDEALRSVSAALASVGEYRSSEVVARRIKNRKEKAFALLLVARSLRDAGQARSEVLFDELEQIIRAPVDDRMYQFLHDISVDRGRDMIQPNLRRIDSRRLAGLSIELAQAGEFARAEKLALSVEEPEEQVKALIGLAGALAEAGSDMLPRIVTETRKKAQSILDKQRQTELLAELVAAVDSAEIAKSTPTVGARSTAEGDPADVYVRKGMFVEAVKGVAGQSIDASLDKSPLDDFVRRLAEWAVRQEGADQDVSLKMMLAAIGVAGWVRSDWAKIDQVLGEAEPL